jgi:hypothetical protein
VEELTIPYHGKTYTGGIEISGSVKLYQTIYYDGRYKEDGHPYRPDERATMRTVARSILRELVEEALKAEPERGG